ncbi:hypothetical protein T439DRAFT_384551 [Meredithblackwellia eburnea MCA 4105]
MSNEHRPPHGFTLGDTLGDTGVEGRRMRREGRTFDNLRKVNSGSFSAEDFQHGNEEENYRHGSGFKDERRPTSRPSSAHSSARSSAARLIPNLHGQTSYNSHRDGNGRVHLPRYDEMEDSGDEEFGYGPGEEDLDAAEARKDQQHASKAQLYDALRNEFKRNESRLAAAANAVASRDPFKNHIRKEEALAQLDTFTRCANRQVQLAQQMTTLVNEMPPTKHDKKRRSLRRLSLSSPGPEVLRDQRINDPFYSQPVQSSLSLSGHIFEPHSLRKHHRW